MPLSEKLQNMKIYPGRRRSPLSVDDLSDPGATAARKLSENYARDDQARFLIKALKDFILPVVHVQGSQSSTENRKKNPNDNIDLAGLGPAAQKLINALESFITSLVGPEVIRKDEVQSKEVSHIPKNTELVPFVISAVDRTQSNSLISENEAPKQPRLLKSALEAARHRVFNKMPIRLLTFKSDGSEINLLDRDAIWNYVSTLIKTRFNEDQLNKDIALEVRNYIPDAEKEVIERYVSPYTRYAILSHTWLHDTPGEVTYGDWNGGNFDTDSPGYRKLATFCKVAAEEHGITLAWMDTICINKTSSAELDESIRSMFKWYRDAVICITYLAQTTTLAHMHNDAWFTRGWTLQELFAPWYIKFYGANWNKLNPAFQNDKQNHLIQTKISAATTITPSELNCDITSTAVPVSRKMQWAANRRVTRQEDTAYSLMGVFNVSISIAYGEGAERAFFRLVQQILNSYVEGIDIINWGYGHDPKHVIDGAPLSSLIPPGPQQYLWRAVNLSMWPCPSIPVTLTHLGLHLSILLMPAKSADNLNLLPFQPIGDYYGTVTINPAAVNWDMQTFIYPSQHYNVLDMASRYDSDNTTADQRQITFGVLNFSTNETCVSLPTIDGSRITCFAVALSFNNSSYSSLAEAIAAKAVDVIPTQTAIAFDLKSPHFMAQVPLPTWVFIQKKRLAQHGMQLLDVYL